MGFIFFLIWIRGTVPRLRQDQLMNFAWKFMLPMALMTILAAASWHFIPDVFTRWLVSSALVVAPYLLLGKGLLAGRQIGKRTYRYAD
jgi:NADH-quinone oxidoreductase subunit H